MILSAQMWTADMKPDGPIALEEDKSSDHVNFFHCSFSKLKAIVFVFVASTVWTQYSQFSLDFACGSALTCTIEQDVSLFSGRCHSSGVRPQLFKILKSNGSRSSVQV